MKQTITSGTEVLVYPEQSGGYVGSMTMAETPVTGHLLSDYDPTSPVNQHVRIETGEDVFFGDQCSWKIKR